MRPLLFAVAGLCLLALGNSSAIDPNKEADDSPGTNKEKRCYNGCSPESGSLQVSESQASPSLTNFPAGAQVHSESFFEGCSTESGCAGVKVKDGKVVEKYGDVGDFNSALAADISKEFTFHSAANSKANEIFGKGVTNEGPFWWMNENSPFKAAYKQQAGGATSANFGGKVDLSGNPFLNGGFKNFASGFANQATGLASQASGFANQAGSAASNVGTYAANPFLNGQASLGAHAGSQQHSASFANQQNSIGYSSGAQSRPQTASKYQGSSPSPFGANQVQSEYDQQQSSFNNYVPQSGKQVEGHQNNGGLLQTCAGQGYICVHKAQCNNGVVNTNGVNIGQANTRKQYCNTKTEICCRIEIPNLPAYGNDNEGQGSNPTKTQGYLPPNTADSNPSPSYVPSTTVRPRIPPTPPRQVPSSQAPPYLPPEQYPDQSVNQDTNVFPPEQDKEGSSIFDETRNPPSRPTQGPPPAIPRQPQPNVFDIPASCAAALKCTPIEYCTAEGVISNDLQVLTKDQEAFRVPLTDCRNLESGVVGKCCRDPTYTDPWPTGQLGKWVPGVFGGDDGAYKPDNRGNPQTERIKATTPPATTGSVYFNNLITTTPKQYRPQPTKGSLFPTDRPFPKRPGQSQSVTQSPFNQPGQEIDQGRGETVNSFGIVEKESVFGVKGQGTGVQQGFGQGVSQGFGQKVNQGFGQGSKQGFGQGINQGFGVKQTGQGVSQGQGEGVQQGFGQGVSQGFGGKVTQGQGFGFKQTGQGVSQGEGEGVQQGFGQGVSQGFGEKETQGQGFGVKQTGQGVTQGQGVGIQQGFGQGVNQGFGEKVTQEQGFGVKQTGQGVSQGQGEGVQQGFGQGVSQGFGKKVTQGQGFGVKQTGQGVSLGQGEGVQQGFGQGVSQGFGETITQGQGLSVKQPGQGIGIQQGFGQGINQGFGEVVSQEQGAAVKPTGEGVSQGQGQGVQQGFGQGVNQGFGQGISQGFGQTVTQGFGQSESGQGVSQGFGQGVTQGQGTITQTGFGIKEQGNGIQQGVGQGANQGFGQGASQGFGQGASQGFGQGVQQTSGFGITQGVGQTLSQGFGETVEETVQRVFLPKYAAGAKCGLQNGQKPYGNRNDLEVDFAEIPWQAMVLLETNRSLLCGGVITRPDVVVTSAQCVDGLKARHVLIKGGEWKLGIDEEPKPFQIVQVKQILRHPFYKSGEFRYDVAILVLGENLRLASNIYPICLPGAKDTLGGFYNGAGECIVTGWGKQILQVNVAGSIMHSINVSLVNPGECTSKLQSDYPQLLRDFDQDSCTCAYPLNPLNNICRVDIGSALACTMGDGHFTLRGVYSWDSGCRQTGDQIGVFYKFDLLWYEWAIGQSEEFGQKYLNGQGSKLILNPQLQAPFGQTNSIQDNIYQQNSIGSVPKPFNSGFTTTFQEKKIYQSQPQFVTYTTKPQIYSYTTKPEVYTYTTKPEVYTYTTKPEVFTYTTKPEVFTYTTKPKYFSFTTPPKYVSYQSAPQIINYETSGSGTNPQYAAPGVSYNPSIQEIFKQNHAAAHGAACQCVEGK